MSRTEDLLIIYETEAKEWASYLQSVFTGPISKDGICCYDITTVSSRKDDFLRLSCYQCKLLILTQGLLEGLCQTRRFFLSRVLSPAGCVVVLLCGVDSLTPLLNLVPLNDDECLQLSSDQDPPDYISSVMDIIRKGASTTAANVNPLTHKPSGSEQKAKQMQSSGADKVRSSVVVIPSRVPCGSSVEVFVLLKKEEADCSCEVEFSGENQKVRVKPVRWNERILCVTAPDFPAGNVKVTVYSRGKSLSGSRLQYYTSIEELAGLLSSVVDPVQFMCQALKVSSVDKLDQKLSSMLLQGMPTGGFQGLKGENTHERVERHHADVPSLLHLAARYGFKGVSGLLLQCPGAERALRTANRLGQIPTEVARRHGHMDLHVLLKEALRRFNSGGDNSDASVYEMMCGAGVSRQQLGEDSDEEEEEDDLYTLLGENDEASSVLDSNKALVLANRPPAPTPRPEGVQGKESKTPYIAQVFQKQKTTKADPDVYSLSYKQAHKPRGGISSNYDTFVPTRVKGLERLIELQQRVKAGSLTVDEAADHFRDVRRVQKSLETKKEEKLSHPGADVISNRDDVYDQINAGHQIPPVKVSSPPGVTANETQRRNQTAGSEFYSKPLRGPQILRKANKR